LDVWVIDAERGTRTRVTAGGENAYPLWTPDGKRIVFSLDPSLTDNAALPARARVIDVDGGATALYAVPADGSRPPEELLKSTYPPYPLSFSPDGAHLAFRILSPVTRNDIEVLSLADHQVSHLQAAPYDELSPAFAPDGRWIAYVSDESGRDEVYVRPYPGQSGKVAVSNGGGRAPVWSRDGRELFYRQGTAVMAVPVTLQPAFTVGKSRRLFEGPYELPSTGGNPYYDVAPDGRFVMIRSVDPAAGRQLRVVLNWFEELSRLGTRGGKH
jgi:dipeptidyl aminopeptidase/acylaminoacyl peptidase